LPLLNEIVAETGADASGYRLSSAHLESSKPCQEIMIRLLRSRVTWGGGNGAATAAISAPQSGAVAIHFLNEQRSANGIPTVSLNQAFATAWCPDENELHKDGGESVREAAVGTWDWSRQSSPWDDGPLHQQAQYDPLYDEAGYTYVAGSACLGLGSPSTMPSRPRFYAFAGDLGPSAVAIGEFIPDEGPFSPEQVARITSGETGPVLILYALGLSSGARKSPTCRPPWPLPPFRSRKRQEGGSTGCDWSTRPRLTGGMDTVSPGSFITGRRS
jgi:hypothetical protein